MKSTEANVKPIFLQIQIRRLLCENVIFTSNAELVRSAEYLIEQSQHWVSFSFATWVTAAVQGNTHKSSVHARRAAKPLSDAGADISLWILSLSLSLSSRALHDSECVCVRAFRERARGDRPHNPALSGSGISTSI